MSFVGSTAGGRFEFHALIAPKSLRQVVIDTETTGLSPTTGHRIIEVAALELVNRVPGQMLHFRLDPEREVDEGAFKVHGMTRDSLRGLPKFGDVAIEIVDFVAGAEWIIHNAPFDIGFLDAEFLAHGFPACSALHAGVIDTLVLARDLSAGRGSLNALCDRLGVDRSRRAVHGAVQDVELLTEVYLRMTREQLAMDVSLPAAMQAPTGPIGPTVVLDPPPDEIAAHNAYLAEMQRESGHCAWLQ